VDSILKRGLRLATGNGGHVQEEIRGARTHRACGLFTDQLPLGQPEQPRFWI
jgi:hypothetical protein